MHFPGLVGEYIFFSRAGEFDFFPGLSFGEVIILGVFRSTKYSQELDDLLSSSESAMGKESHSEIEQLFPFPGLQHDFFVRDKEIRKYYNLNFRLGAREQAILWMSPHTRKGRVPDLEVFPPLGLGGSRYVAS